MTIPLLKVPGLRVYPTGDRDYRPLPVACKEHDIPVFGPWQDFFKKLCDFLKFLTILLALGGRILSQTCFT